MSTIDEYVESHIDAEPIHLAAIDRATNLRLVNGRMCSGHLQGRLLNMLTRMIRPKRALELGTFSGYSGICIAEALEPGCTLDTIEIDDELEEFIRKNISSSPAADRIRLHIGDAVRLLKGAPPDSFDMIFMDADKRLYPEYYDLCLPILRSGGYIIADNTLWGGHVVDPSKSRDPQTRGIIEFNDTVAADPRVEKVMIPLRDGLTIIRKL